jgi:hypothetical protein
MQQLRKRAIASGCLVVGVRLQPNPEARLWRRWSRRVREIVEESTKTWECVSCNRTMG